MCVAYGSRHAPGDRGTRGVAVDGACGGLEALAERGDLAGEPRLLRLRAAASAVSIAANCALQARLLGVEPRVERGRSGPRAASAPCRRCSRGRRSGCSSTPVWACRRACRPCRRTSSGERSRDLASSRCRAPRRAWSSSMTSLPCLASSVDAPPLAGGTSMPMSASASSMPRQAGDRVAHAGAHRARASSSARCPRTGRPRRCRWPSSRSTTGFSSSCGAGRRDEVVVGVDERP